MKKRFLSLMLALVMCLGLCATASAEEKSYTGSELRAMFKFYRYTDFVPDLNYWIPKQLTLNNKEKSYEVAGYNVFEKEAQFSLKNDAEADCTFKGNFYIFKKGTDGVYMWDGICYELRTNGKLVDYELEENDANGYKVRLRPGEQSPKFSFTDLAETAFDGDKGDQTYLYEFKPYFLFDDNKEKWQAGNSWRCMVDPVSVKQFNEGETAFKAFTDVPEDSAFAKGIRWAVQRSVANGKSATSFAPSDVCTISHILTFLWRANGRPGAGSDERAAVTAWANGLGIDTSNLSAPCTRAMAVTYMWKAAGSPAPSKAASFSDVASDAGYAQAVSWAVEKGVTSGTGDGTTFSPSNTCTRGQIVTFLYRANG